MDLREEINAAGSFLEYLLIYRRILKSLSANLTLKKISKLSNIIKYLAGCYPIFQQGHRVICWGCLDLLEPFISSPLRKGDYERIQVILETFKESLKRDRLGEQFPSIFFKQESILLGIINKAREEGKHDIVEGLTKALGQYRWKLTEGYLDCS